MNREKIVRESLVLARVMKCSKSLRPARFQNLSFQELFLDSLGF